MTSKTKTGATIDPMTPVVLTPAEREEQLLSLEFLQAEKIRIDAALKEAKAAQPQRSKLEKVIERQTSKPQRWIPQFLAKYVRERERAGQDSRIAYNEVIAQYSAAVIVELERAATPTEPEPAAE